jgi:3',5'-cyclic-nucleotide phosphodiesterase
MSTQPGVNGAQHEAGIAVPITEGDVAYAVVLRGPEKFPIFGERELAGLTAVAPAIAHGIFVSETLSGIGTELKESDSLAAMLELAEVLTAQLDRQRIIELITTKSRAVTNADRCSLLLVEGDSIRSHFHSGLSEPIKLELGNGLAGVCIRDGAVINVKDAYSDPRFNRAVDEHTGYRTTTILVVPIFNTQGKVIGCTEMLNCNSGAFTEQHVRSLRIFNVFCGIALENSDLLHDLFARNEELSAVYQSAFAMSRADDVGAMLAGILENSRRAIGADSSAFLRVNGEALEPLESSATGDFGAAKLARERRSFVITKGTLAVPVTNQAGEVTAVVEVMGKKGDFSERDVGTLNVFATFAGVAMQFTGQAPADPLEAALSEWVSPEERDGFEIPVKLKLTEEEITQVSSMACFSPDFKGIGHFKELFHFFAYFDFFRKFNVTAARFFKFLHLVSARYTGTPYHNWSHACDVTQCVFFQITVGKVGTQYEDWEIFTLFIAAICHDTNHEGLNNVYNIKAETPLGILFKDTSVMEMHHITEALPILSCEEVNMFGSFDQVKVRRVWSLFINLILATDMAKHFDLVKRATAALDGEGFNFSDPDFRLLGLQLLLKVGDISNVSRPFAIADKWCDILNKEFFHQGDLEKTSGIGLTSPLNDRDAANKPKSQIGFYNFICLPLYTAVARLYPPLMANVDSIQQNLATWKDLVAKQTPAAPPA